MYKRRKQFQWKLRGEGNAFEKDGRQHAGKFNELKETKREKERERERNGKRQRNTTKTRDAWLHTRLRQAYPRRVTQPVEGCNARLHNRVRTPIRVRR